MFAPSWNTLYPLLTMFAFWLFLLAYEKEGFAAWLLYGASGFIVGLLTFANISMIPLAGIFGFYALLHFYFKERSSENFLRPVKIGIAFGVGVVAIWVLYYLVSGVTPFDILDVALGRHLGQERPYLPWVWFHGWEWALFTGIPLIAVWLLGAWRTLRDRRTTPNLIALSLFATMLILLISGTARGETGRVWLFFSPFVLLAALPVFASEQKAISQKSSLWLITLAHAAVTVAMASVLPVIDVIDFTDPPQPPEVNPDVRGTYVEFETVRLVGWEGAIEEGSLTLHLNWQPTEQILTPYWFALLLVDGDGNPIGETHVWQPLDTRYPTTCWQTEQTVSDTLIIPLPEDILTGDLWLSLVILPDVDQPENRLSVSLPDGSRDQQIGLGPIKKAGETPGNSD